MSSVVAPALSIQSLERELTELHVLGDPVDTLGSFIHLLCDQLGYEKLRRASLTFEYLLDLSSTSHQTRR